MVLLFFPEFLHRGRELSRLRPPSPEPGRGVPTQLRGRDRALMLNKNPPNGKVAAQLFCSHSSGGFR
jgi:hypothetical protein